MSSKAAIAAGRHHDQHSRHRGLHSPPREFGALIAGINRHVSQTFQPADSVAWHNDLGLAVGQHSWSGWKNGARQLELPITHRRTGRQRSLEGW